MASLPLSEMIPLSRDSSSFGCPAKFVVQEIARVSQASGLRLSYHWLDESAVLPVNLEERVKEKTVLQLAPEENLDPLVAQHFFQMLAVTSPETFFRYCHVWVAHLFAKQVVEGAFRGDNLDGCVIRPSTHSVPYVQLPSGEIALIDALAPYELEFPIAALIICTPDLVVAAMVLTRLYGGLWQEQSATTLTAVHQLHFGQILADKKAAAEQLGLAHLLTSSYSGEE